MGEREDFSILFVEDDMDSAEEIVRNLEARYKCVTHAEHGAMGLELFRATSPDLVISDIRMPHMDGISMGRSIRSLSKDVPLLYLSAHKDGEYLQSAIDIGAEGYISKPINLEKLFKKIDSIKSAYEAKKEIAETKQLMNEYLKALDVSVIFSKTDLKGRITYANEAFCEISGYSKDELIGASHSIIRHPNVPSSIFRELWDTIQNGQIWKGIIKNRRKDGSSYTVESTIIPILNSSGEICEYIALRYDITKMHNHNLSLQDVARKNEELSISKSKEMIDRLLKDEVSGLPNVLSLKRELQQRDSGALLLLDINNFNILNKLHGFHFGDMVLKEVGEHLKHTLTKNAKLYKLSGDRFAILKEGFLDSDIENLSNQIFAYFDSVEIEIEIVEVNISFSIGAARIDKRRDVIIDAEFALDKSKKLGKRFFVIYHKDIDEFEEEREFIKKFYKIREYISKDMITPWYQPIVSVESEKVYKYEALARIVDKDILLSPADFLKEAKRLGLLSTITKSMINKTFRDFGNTDVSFSINISEDDLVDGYLYEFIEHKAEKNSIKPSQVTFEVLENLSISSGSEGVAKTLKKLSSLGYKIAIDDFGSDRSNFSRFLSLRSDYIKIDGIFVQGCESSVEKQQIIDAIVQLAKRLKIKTVAEFVSTKEIFETIKKLGVDYAQGYYFGRPEPR
jgi:PAS domain S-box-containing protein/diguanylate cyclase (GGDEF)-like protein